MQKLVCNVRLESRADALEARVTDARSAEVRFGEVTFTEDEIRRSVEEATSRDGARGLISTL